MYQVLRFCGKFFSRPLLLIVIGMVAAPVVFVATRAEGETAAPRLERPMPPTPVGGFKVPANLPRVDPPAPMGVRPVPPVMAPDAKLDASEVKTSFLFEAQTILDGLKFANGQRDICRAPCLRPEAFDLNLDGVRNRCIKSEPSALKPTFGLDPIAGPIMAAVEEACNSFALTQQAQSGSLADSPAWRASISAIIQRLEPVLARERAR